MTTEEELEVKANELTVRLDDAVAAWQASKDDNGNGEARYNLDAAQREMAEYRKWWREIGQMMPEDHPGHRPSLNGMSTLGVRVVDNEGGA